MLETFTFLKKSVFVRVSHSLNLEGKHNSKSLEILINEEGNDLKTLFTVLSLVTSHNRPQSPTPTSSFVFSWRCYLRWWLRPLQGVTATLEGKCVFKLGQINLWSQISQREKIKCKKPIYYLQDIYSCLPISLPVLDGKKPKKKKKTVSGPSCPCMGSLLHPPCNHLVIWRWTTSLRSLETPIDLEMH